MFGLMLVCVSYGLDFMTGYVQIGILEVPKVGRCRVSLEVQV
jgi:hypothetical protein